MDVLYATVTLYINCVIKIIHPDIFIDKQFPLYSLEKILRKFLSLNTRDGVLTNI